MKRADPASPLLRRCMGLKIGVRAMAISISLARALALRGGDPAPVRAPTMSKRKPGNGSCSA